MEVAAAAVKPSATLTMGVLAADGTWTSGPVQVNAPVTGSCGSAAQRRALTDGSIWAPLSVACVRAAGGNGTSGSAGQASPSAGSSTAGASAGSGSGGAASGFDASLCTADAPSSGSSGAGGALLPPPDLLVGGSGASSASSSSGSASRTASTLFLRQQFTVQRTLALCSINGSDTALAVTAPVSGTVVATTLDMALVQARLLSLLATAPAAFPVGSRQQLVAARLQAALSKHITAVPVATALATSGPDALVPAPSLLVTLSVGAPCLNSSSADALAAGEALSTADPLAAAALTDAAATQTKWQAPVSAVLALAAVAAAALLILRRRRKQAAARKAPSRLQQAIRMSTGKDGSAAAGATEELGAGRIPVRRQPALSDQEVSPAALTESAGKVPVLPRGGSAASAKAQPVALKPGAAVLHVRPLPPLAGSASELKSVVSNDAGALKRGAAQVKASGADTAGTHLTQNPLLHGGNAVAAVGLPSAAAGAASDGPAASASQRKAVTPLLGRLGSDANNAATDASATGALRRGLATVNTGSAGSLTSAVALPKEPRAGVVASPLLASGSALAAASRAAPRAGVVQNPLLAGSSRLGSAGAALSGADASGDSAASQRRAVTATTSLSSLTGASTPDAAAGLVVRHLPSERSTPDVPAARERQRSRVRREFGQSVTRNDSGEVHPSVAKHTLDQLESFRKAVVPIASSDAPAPSPPAAGSSIPLPPGLAWRQQPVPVVSSQLPAAKSASALAQGIAQQGLAGAPRQLITNPVASLGGTLKKATVAEPAASAAAAPALASASSSGRIKVAAVGLSTPAEAAPPAPAEAAAPPPPPPSAVTPKPRLLEAAPAAAAAAAAQESLPLGMPAVAPLRRKKKSAGGDRSPSLRSTREASAGKSRRKRPAAGATDSGSEAPDPSAAAASEPGQPTRSKSRKRVVGRALPGEAAAAEASASAASAAASSAAAPAAAAAAADDGEASTFFQWKEKPPAPAPAPPTE